MSSARTPVERWAEKVDFRAASGCWEWTASRNHHGYGNFKADGFHRAHRWAYWYFVAPIPDGLVIDHLCRNRACVNPDHLEPVTCRENSRRGYFGQKTHCPQGHEYTPENTYRKKSDNTRMCKACRRDSMRRLSARRRAA